MIKYDSIDVIPIEDDVNLFDFFAKITGDKPNS